ncbi:hypothetical protein PAAG_12643, partial [Paracoccidioides lutzii Pb01]
IFNNQTFFNISATISSIIKKVLDSHSGIQCYYCNKKDYIVKNYSIITKLIKNNISESSADSKKSKYERRLYFKLFN